MQAVKDKLSDMSTMRKAKAEAKAEEKAEKELAKTRVEAAHELRKAREAEAAMELHVAKAGQKVDSEMAKHSSLSANEHIEGGPHEHQHPHHHHNRHGYNLDVTGDPVAGIMSPTNMTGGPTSNKYI